MSKILNDIEMENDNGVELIDNTCSAYNKIKNDEKKQECLLFK